MLKSPEDGRQELERRVLVEWPMRGGEKVYVQIAGPDGKALWTTPETPLALREHMAALPAAAPPRSLSLGEQRPSGDRSGSYQAIARVLPNAIGLAGQATVRIAVGEEQSLDFMGELRGVLAAILLANIFFSLCVGWWIVRHEMRPLREMARQIANIDAQNRRARLNVASLPAELRALAVALNGAFDALATAIDRLSRFSSDVAHELRTPISNIMGAAEVALARTRAESEYRDVLESTLEECLRIRRITDSLLFLARVERQDVHPTFSEVSIKKELEALIEFYLPIAEEAGVSLRLQGAAADAGATACVEPTLFQQAIGNLIQNAISHSGAGATIDLIYFKIAGELSVNVSDDGLGISEKDLPHVFERFYRVDPSRTGRSGGSGLGLAIVKSIVELHGGAVRASSDLGQGSRFETRWPLPRDLCNVHA